MPSYNHGLVSAKPIHVQILGGPEVPSTLTHPERGGWGFRHHHWPPPTPSAHTVCPCLSIPSIPRATPIGAKIWLGREGSA